MMGAGADGVDANVLRAEIDGKVADRSLKGRLGDAHHVVVGDDLLSAVVGHGEHGRAGVQHGLEGMAERGQGIGRDVQGRGRNRRGRFR